MDQQLLMAENAQNDLAIALHVHKSTISRKTAVLLDAALEWIH